MGVVALGRSQVGHVRREVTLTFATIMLGVGKMKLPRSLRDQITHIMKGPILDAISIATATAPRAASSWIIATALNHLRFGQVLNTRDSLSTIRYIFSRSRHGSPSLVKIVPEK
jgi:hypothetical protein